MEISRQAKHILGLIYCDMIDLGCSTINKLSRRSSMDSDYLKRKIDEFERLGLVELRDGGENIVLTQLGRLSIKVVFTRWSIRHYSSGTYPYHKRIKTVRRHTCDFRSARQNGH